MKTSNSNKYPMVICDSKKEPVVRNEPEPLENMPKVYRSIILESINRNKKTFRKCSNSAYYS